MIANAVYSLLSGDAGVTAIASTRIYPNVAPQEAASPYAVYQVISADHQEVLGGSAGFSRTLVQVTCWSTSYDTARSLAEACRLALQGYHGTAASIDVDGVNLVGDRDVYEASRSAQEPGWHGAQMDYAFWHAEAVPVFS